MVRKLASLGKNLLLHPMGSLSNYNREEYISSISSSSNYYSIFESFTTIGAGGFVFLKLLLLAGGFSASAAGFAISLSKLPGTIWL